MSPENRLTVFEHDQLRVDGERFRAEHLVLLDRWNCARDRSVIQVGRSSVKFSEYVGVLQVGDLVMEILPKVGRYESEADARSMWRDALWGMLQRVGIVKSQSAGEASLRTSRQSLLDALFEELLLRADVIARRGFAKGYRHTQQNIDAVRGRIMFAEQTKRNHVHKEKTYCRYLTYTPDVHLNQILKRAIDIVSRSARVPWMAGESRRLLLHFDNVDSSKVDTRKLRHIAFNRATEHCRGAITIARPIIEGRAPSLATGADPVVAILFDMNELFEAYIYMLFRRAERSIPNLRVRGQKSKLFWERRSVRPDIVMEYADRRIMLDTKWKTPINNTPADADLKQMFAYNRVFDSKESYLLYPGTAQQSVRRTGTYSEGLGACSMEYIELFDDQYHIRRDLLSDVQRLISSATA
jgi:5-methylcytosine-specific restriction enzyme subunit McrC